MTATDFFVDTHLTESMYASHILRNSASTSRQSVLGSGLLAQGRGRKDNRVQLDDISPPPAL